MSVCPIVPWEVAEAVALRLAKLAPSSLRIVGTDYGRIHRVAHEGLEPLPMVVPATADATVRVESLVWLSDGETPEAGAREALLCAARACSGDVVIVETVEPGRGIGPTLLRRIDPGLSFIESDELTSERGTPRQRKPCRGHLRSAGVEAPQGGVGRAREWSRH